VGAGDVQDVVSEFANQHFRTKPLHLGDLVVDYYLLDDADSVSARDNDSRLIQC
jgi:hypothetical protein